jgi:putative transposase
LRYKERDAEKRMAYLRELRQIIAKNGSKNIVYVDETGFEPHSYRPYAWGKRGKIIFGDRSGLSRPRTSLIAAHRKNTFIAPMIFTGTADTELVNTWVEQVLIKELRPHSTLIFDNARFHSKTQLMQIAQKHGHEVLFLPPYSPDFNPIEQDFANIKKQRQMAELNTPIEDIIKTYNYVLE